MKLWHWALVGGGALSILWYFHRRSCPRCVDMASRGSFQRILQEFDGVCPECVQVGIDNSVAALDQKMEECEVSPTPTCEGELARYWHNLFQMGQRAGMTEEVGQNLIDLTAQQHPVLERYRANGYTVIEEAEYVVV